jgi:mannosyltransferase
LPRFESTTILLRPAPSTATTDLWDDVLRLARRTEHHTTRTLIRRWSPWLVPAIATFIVGAVGLGRPGLWTDELATWGMATTPWREFWPVLRYVDAVLAPYYVFMHCWVSVFGDSDIALRAPSLLAMVGAAAMVGHLGYRLVGRTAGLVGGLVFALLPSTSRFAAEARPYALSVLVACVATALLVRAWQTPTVRWWIAYALAIAVLGWLHVVAILLVAAHAWLVLAWKRDVMWRFAAAAVVGVGSIAPLLYLGARQRHQVSYIPRVGFDTAFPYSQVLFGGIAVALVIAVLALFSLPLRFPSAVFASWAVVPAVALIVVSLAIPMFLPRYLVYTTPAWALLAGVALSRLRLVWSVLFVATIAALAVPAQLQMRTAGGHDQATRQLAEVIAAAERPGDAIVYADDERNGAWTLRDTVAHYIPAPSRPRDVLAVTAPRRNGLLLATECPDVNRCLAGVTRIWVVRIGALRDPTDGLGSAKQAVLRGQFRVQTLWYPTGLTAALLQRTSGGS